MCACIRAPNVAQSASCQVSLCEWHNTHANTHKHIREHLKNLLQDTVGPPHAAVCLSAIYELWPQFWIKTFRKLHTHYQQNVKKMHDVSGFDELCCVFDTFPEGAFLLNSPVTICFVIPLL